MHIPDGMLSTPVWAAGWAALFGVVGTAVREVRRRLTDGTLALMAVLAALIFALQMLNFPVAGGTSGHFAGGAAAAILLGPWPAVVIMTAVLSVQSLVFADGGITALGANVVNMAALGPFVGWWIYTLAGRIGGEGGGPGGRAAVRSAAAFMAAWAAALASALGAAVMIWASGAAPFGLVVGSMAFWHALIGVGEGVITAGLVGYLGAVRPDLLGEARKGGRPLAAVAGLGAMAAAAVGVSFLASSHPDGLESVAERLGFAPSAGPVFGASPLPDYVVPGMSNDAVAGVLAGLVGVVLTAALVYSGLAAVKRKAVAARGSGDATPTDG